MGEWKDGGKGGREGVKTGGKEEREGAREEGWVNRL